MTIPRMTVITLGVANLARATDFYSRLFSTPPVTQYEGVTFIPLPGVWLSLYPLEKLVEDTGQNVPLPAPGTFRSFTLAYNARSKEEILASSRLPPGQARISQKHRRIPSGAATAATSPTPTDIAGK
ncbi:MAG: hypothetical protein Q7U78_04145 [Gallionella sp.]|nr:hypothetical protein [Gallionella sp.]